MTLTTKFLHPVCQVYQKLAIVFSAFMDRIDVSALVKAQVPQIHLPSSGKSVASPFSSSASSFSVLNLPLVLHLF